MRLTCVVTSWLSSIIVFDVVLVHCLIDFGCRNQCGRAKRGELKGMRNHAAVFGYQDASARIVNGYEPMYRPWMVFIQLHPEKSVYRPPHLRRSQQCGGALINKEWVITASHCFCMGDLKCTTSAPSQILYGLDRVSLYVGQHDITLLKANPDLMHSAIKIILHPKYIRNKRDMNDLALVKLDRPIKPNKYTSPICLPDPDFKDEEVEVFVTGWGALNDAKCLTTGEGPVTHQMCSLPFVWMNFTFHTCSFQSTPSSANPLCRKFAELHPGHWNIDNIDSQINIMDDKGSLAASCYNELPGQYGWCGTCNPDAKRGSPGFCRKRKGGKGRRPRTYARPTFGSDWGWCQKQCDTGLAGRSAILQEVELKTLTNAQCQELGKPMKAVPRIELCAASVAKRKQPIVYRTTDDGFEAIGTESQDSGETLYGGKDSCKGDSGGPLFTWVNDRAVLVGVVSRGKGCAAHNQVGIYTRITHHLKWMQDHVTSGHCEI